MVFVLILCTAVFLMPRMAWAVPGSSRPSEDVQTAVQPQPADVQVYVHLGLQNNPAVQAAFAQWSAAVHDIAQARALPSPTLSFGVFIRAIETRTGPQRVRANLQQSLPWPDERAAQHAGAEAAARAMAAALADTTLQVRHQIQLAYWALWEIRAIRATHEAHLSVVDSLSETLRARMEVGSAGLADVQQVDLSRARLESDVQSMYAAETLAMASLREAVGVVDAALVPTEAPPTLATPAHSHEVLLEQLGEHPTHMAVQQHGVAAEHAVAVARAQRRPGVSVGVDWVGIGAEATVADTGRDAVAVGVGLQLPIWQRVHAENIRAAEDRAQAVMAAQQDVQLQLHAAVVRMHAQVEDSARRVVVNRDVLLPQAEAVHTALLGQYAAGSAQVAQLLLAQRDLLELTIERDQALADHARAWAGLELACGGPVARNAAGGMP